MCFISKLPLTISKFFSDWINLLEKMYFYPIKITYLNVYKYLVRVLLYPRKFLIFWMIILVLLNVFLLIGPLLPLPPTLLWLAFIFTVLSPILLCKKLAWKFNLFFLYFRESPIYLLWIWDPSKFRVHFPFVWSVKLLEDLFNASPSLHSVLLEYRI